MNNLQKPIIGKKYQYRKYAALGLPDLMKIKVTNLSKINDGREVVTFTYNFPFTIKEDVYLEKFNKNVVYE